MINILQNHQNRGSNPWLHLKTAFQSYALYVFLKNKTYTSLNEQNAKHLVDNVKRGGECGGG